MVGAERCHHVVHDLLHRLDAAGGLRVHGGEAAVGIVHDLAQSLAEHLQLLLRGLGKFNALAAQLLGVLFDFDRQPIPGQDGRAPRPVGFRHGFEVLFHGEDELACMVCRGYRGRGPVL